jgi:SAM-dependent methyltransferase
LHSGQDAVKIGDKLIKSDRWFDGSNITKLLPEFEKFLSAKNSVVILDYGSGKAEQLHSRKILNGQTFHEKYAGKIAGYWCYDPGYKPFSRRPPNNNQFDVVFCADVMEHVPEALVPNTLAEIGSFLRPGGQAFFTISTRPAVKEFADGENLHATVQPMTWWEQKIKDHFGPHSIFVIYD